MSSARNLRRVVVGLSALLGLIAAGVWVSRTGRPAATPAAREQTVQPVNKELRMEKKGQLQPGREKAHKDMVFQEGEDGHQLDISLQTGQFLHVIVEQRGVDVEAVLYRPDGERRIGVDSPNGSEGPEILFDVAEQTGLYRLDVVPADTVAPQGKYDVWVEAAREADEQDRRHVEAWRTFRKGEKLRRNGRWRDALAAYGPALKEWQELGNPEWEAEAQFRIGWMHNELREMDQALPALRAALPFFRDTGRRHDEAVLHNRIGDCLYRKGELAQAITEHENALVIARSLGDRTLEAGALIGLGNAQIILGEAQKALSCFQEAVMAARAAGDSDGEKKALFGLGNAFVYQGKLPEARDALQQAFQVQQTEGNDRENGVILRRLADVDLREESYPGALQRLEKALSLARKAEDRESEAVTLNSLGTVQLFSGATEEAGQSYRRALEIFRALGNTHGEAFALLNLGRYYHRKKIHGDALRSYDQAIALSRKIGVRHGEVMASFGAAQVLHDQQDFRGANEKLRRVIGLVESLRLESESQDLRASFLATKQHYHELQIDVLMHLHEAEPTAGYEVQALEANEARRARSLLELLSERRIHGSLGKEEAKLLEREQGLLQQVEATERELLSARESGEEGRGATLAARQRSLLSDLDTVQTQIRQSGSAQLAVVRPRPIGLTEMRDELDDHTLLVVYALGEERSFVWCVSRKGPVVSKILPRRSLLEGTARELLDAWSGRQAGTRRRAGHWAESLGRDLLQPIAPALDDKRLVFVGDGLLQSLPFAALPDPAADSPPGESPAPIAVQHEVVQLPSVSVLAALRSRMREGKGMPQFWAAVIADPVFGGTDDDRLAGIPAARRPDVVPVPQGSNLDRAARTLGIDFSRLKFTGSEADAILDLFGDQALPLLGFDASRQKLQQLNLQDYRILHFATHGLVDPKHSEVAGLVLSLVDEQGNPQDGFLLAQEIGNLKIGAGLVVLSACSTGLGKEVRGEGPLSLTRSFFCAGAPRVVVSLWNVNDAGTAELMKRFYRLMVHERFPPAAALRCAQVSMLKSRWSDPYIWAPFIFQGDWEDVARRDGGIEKRASGTGIGDDSDGSLPGGGGGGKKPPRCPDLI